MFPRVSIIIPTYNEADDIRGTLDALMALDYPAVEILVVDASRDATPEIVMSYPPQKVRVIRQSRGRGRAAARNEGILATNGDLVIILNADVRLPPDFVARIAPHYAAGADYVLVESRVTNLEHTSARYVQALHQSHYPPVPAVEAQMNWTEGISCRRQAALAVGLIPEGSPFPLLAGEDGWFGEKLAAAGYRKVLDRSIVVTHVMPSNIKTFWDQRAGRGHGTIQIWKMRDGWPASKIILTAAWLCLLGGLSLLAPLAALRRAWRLTRHSPRGKADWLAFAAMDWTASAANLSGLVTGVIELLRSGAN